MIASTRILGGGLNGRACCRKEPRLWLVLGAIMGVSFCVPAAAQWITQNISLEPGWNAVFLEVEPSPARCEDVFAGMPIEMVAMRNPASASVQYISNPDDIVPESPEWQVYVDPSTAPTALTTLHVLQGGKAYQIKLGGDSTVAWAVRGRPVLRKVKWAPDSFNFVGFHVDAAGGTSFASFFEASSAHAGQLVYGLNASGEWEQVTNLDTEGPAQGKAYWVYSAGQSSYQGPVELAFERGKSLDYSDTLTELILQLKNVSGSTQSCTLDVLDSEAPLDPGEAVLAGAVPLSRWDPAALAWVELTGPAVVEVPAESQYRLRLAVRRADMTPFTPPPSGEFLYQSLLTVAYGPGNLLPIPVTSHGLGGVAAAKSKDVSARAGLWLGHAVINKVEEVTEFPETEQPAPTDTEFQFRLIVHVDAGGTARLLQQVTEMWRPGTYMPDPNNPEFEVMDEPGSVVLITEQTLLASFEGVAVRDTAPVGRRVSSAAFSFRVPIEMTGDFPTPVQPVASLACTVGLDYDDPLNPFKHKYHPDHDNFDDQQEEQVLLDAGLESYPVIRAITLEFTESDPEQLQLPGWGDNQVGGLYKETFRGDGAVAGLHKEDIDVEGFFRLRRVSTAGELNPTK